MDICACPHDPDRLAAWLQHTDGRPRVIVVYGPTASGKTVLSLDIAETVAGEIISADARQVYRHLDIGTGKIRPDEMRGIPHHMIDIIGPDEEYSVGLFRQETGAIVERLHASGRIPVICGGTGLYIDALIYDYAIPEVPPDWDFRAEMERMIAERGCEAVWELLRTRDPDYATTLDPRNTRYVVRALEVLHHTGHSKSVAFVPKTLKYDTFLVTPYDGDREELYACIGQRVRGMFAAGLVDELKSMLSSDYTSLSP